MAFTISMTMCQQSKYKKLFILLGVAISLAIVLSVILIVELSRADESDGHKDSKPHSDDKPWLEMRLPKSIVPHNYSLFLDVDMETLSYNGVVTVHVKVLNETSFVLLHKEGLNISDSKIKRLSGKDNNNNNNNIVLIEKTFAYAPNEFWVIKTNEKLEIDSTYAVTVKFDGVVTKDLSGFYRNVFVDKKTKETKKLALTFFSPISARKAFPCFDEPAFKASFQISLKHSSNYAALSNMPVSSVQTNGETRTTVFEPSLKMSTYIVCWVICEFKHKALVTPQGLVIKGWARDAIVDSITYSLNSTEVLLHEMEDYFNISFPLRKPDMVAVPSFGPNAMENWGLITYREDRMLISNALPSKANRFAYTTIAHELVHQWFGNLATMKFWTEVWLKEGFANFIGKMIGDKIKPSLELMKNVLLDLTVPALTLDAFSTSNPISTQAKTPDEIREVFGVVTYMKGYCVVQMLKQFMGEISFRKGLQRYLRTYAYSNANQDDLWEQLSLEAHGKDIKAVMDTWTLQMGYPVITTTQINDTHMQVEQTKFSLDPPGTDLPPSPFNYMWHVPIIFKQPSTNQKHEYLLVTKRAVIEVPFRSILNPNHKLYYRVNYHKEMVLHLTQMLQENHTSLSVSDRTGLISDQFSFFQANLTDLSTVLNLIKYLKNETEYVTWVVASDQMKVIEGLLEDSKKDEQKWKTFMRGLIEDFVQQNGWKNSTKSTTNELQVILLKLACDLNVTSVVKEAELIYRNWMKGSMILGEILHAVMMECVISHNSYEHNSLWQFAYKEYLKDQDEKILTALAYTKNETLLDSHDYGNSNLDLSARINYVSKRGRCSGVESEKSDSRGPGFGGSQFCFFLFVIVFFILF